MFILYVIISVTVLCGSPQVFLGPHGEVEEYSVTSVQKNAAISSDLILDQSEEHLFIMTHSMVPSPIQMKRSFLVFVP